MHLNTKIFSKGRLYSFYCMKSAKWFQLQRSPKHTPSRLGWMREVWGYRKLCRFRDGCKAPAHRYQGKVKREISCLCTWQKPQHKVTAMSLQQGELWHLRRAAGREEQTLSFLEDEGNCQEGKDWQYMVWNWPPEENPFSLSTALSSKPQTAGQYDTACYSFLQV